MNVQHLEVFAGDNRTFTLFARDYSNLPVNLTGLTINWNVGRRPNDPTNWTPLFTKTGTIVSAPAGSFTVAVLPADTTSIFIGDYQHMAQTVDAQGNVTTVCVGRFRVRPAIGVTDIL